MATATTSISTGFATATATATSAGGAGGAGGRNFAYGIGGPGGSGGAASSSATASNTNGPASATATSIGGNGGPGGLGGLYASTGPAGAAGAAQAKSDAKNSHAEVVTTASAPGGGAGTSSAVTAAMVGQGNVALANITSGRAVSNAILIPGDFGAGAMSAGLGGQPQYEATAVFDFRTSKSEPLYLNLRSDTLAGTGFGIALEIFANAMSSTPTFSYPFSSLAGLGRAQSFFASHPLPLVAGNQSVKLEYLLNYTPGTPYSPGYGFDFTYDFASSAVAATPIAAAFEFPVSQSSTVPEPSTWAMMLVGFAGLAFAGYRE
jgi:hypothetical protein